MPLNPNSLSAQGPVKSLGPLGKSPRNNQSSLVGNVKSLSFSSGLLGSSQNLGTAGGWQTVLIPLNFDPFEGGTEPGGIHGQTGTYGWCGSHTFLINGDPDYLSQFIPNFDINRVNVAGCSWAPLVFNASASSNNGWLGTYWALNTLNTNDVAFGQGIANP